ncbi:MAG: hypothetical protein JST90_14690 [Bacteroidetes bacterium]|nr:hypothetical protein [Bacteroidota bacterium]
MEKTGKLIRILLGAAAIAAKVAIYIFWGASRLVEVILSETNRLLKRVLEQKKNQ